MLRLPAFEFHQPHERGAACQLLASLPQSLLMAGGSDLLPAMKTGQARSPHVVSLMGVLPDEVEFQPGQTIARSPSLPGRLVVGAGIRLSDLACHPLVREWAPSLARSAELVASPLIRNRATLGGNLCLQPRCRYINQTQLFRESLGGCLKSHGDLCHVVPGGTRCVAALSADTVPVLVALGARVSTTGPQGQREFPLIDLYTGDGVNPLDLRPGEWIERVILEPESPCPEGDGRGWVTPVSPSREGDGRGWVTRVAYRKWRPRQSIDFPLVSLALRMEVEQQRLRGGLLVVAVLGPKPRCLALDKLVGLPIDGELPGKVVDLARSLRPLANVPYDPEYRRRRTLLEIERAVRQWL